MTALLIQIILAIAAVFLLLILALGIWLFVMWFREWKKAEVAFAERKREFDAQSKRVGHNIDAARFFQTRK